ncbi:hypothetical protein GGX14DRAFT_398511 [Mycena pura]|uniref:Uncharacterized protein n=1 Tax=Mycena pura TaxID=153505 RepID=A0AAD6V8A1_9AGAR|nr:hypothetical protein GGX14DRAFT_398511 [Mycena pura]
MLEETRVPKAPSSISPASLDKSPAVVQMAWLALDYISQHNIIGREPEAQIAISIWTGIRTWIDFMEDRFDSREILDSRRATTYFLALSQLITHEPTMHAIMEWPSIFFLVGTAWPHIFSIIDPSTRERAFLFLYGCLMQPQMVPPNPRNLSELAAGSGGPIELGKLIVKSGKAILADSVHDYGIWPLANTMTCLISGTSFEKALLDTLISHKLVQLLCRHLIVWSTRTAIHAEEWIKIQGIVFMMTGILIRPSGHTRLHIAISEGYAEALLALLAEDGMPEELGRMIKYFFTDTLPTGMVKFKAVQALIPRYPTVANTMRHVVATGKINLSAALFAQMQTIAGDPMNTLGGYRTWRAEQLKIVAESTQRAIYADAAAASIGITAQAGASEKIGKKDIVRRVRSGDPASKRTGIRDIGLTRRDINYMRHVIDAKSRADGAQIWGGHRRLLLSDPNCLTIATFKYHGYGHQTDVSIGGLESVMQAVGHRPERFNLSAGTFEDLTRRMRASSWRVMIHVLTVSFAGEMHAIVYPYHTGAVHIGVFVVAQQCHLIFLIVLERRATTTGSSSGVDLFGCSKSKRSELASLQLTTSDAFWERAVGWSAAWRVWCSHCVHRHRHTLEQTDVHVIEEIFDEPLSEPLSPDPEWSAVSTGCGHSAGTPPPTPDAKARDEAFLNELDERLRIIEWEQIEGVASDLWVRRLDRKEESNDTDE